jgi:small subunit ribosomal protein S6
MSLYEHTCIARQDLSAQQAQTLTETLTQLVTDNGGTVGKTEYWGLRNLAYRIQKSRKGHYIHLNIEAPAATILELERNERFNEDVLRFLTVKVDELSEAPSAVMQARSGRDDRGRRDRDGGGRDRDRDRGDRDRDRGDRDRGDRERGDGGRGRGETAS